MTIKVGGYLGFTTIPGLSSIVITFTIKKGNRNKVVNFDLYNQRRRVKIGVRLTFVIQLCISVLGIVIYWICGFAFAYGKNVTLDDNGDYTYRLGRVYFRTRLYN